MKKFLKIFMFLILFAVLAGGGYYVFINYIQDKPQRNAFSIIPNDAIFMFETSNLTEGWTAVSDSKLWQQMMKNPYLNELDAEIKMVDEYLKKNKAVELVLKDRQLFVSAHMTSAINWDFIFVVDLQNAKALTDGLAPALKVVEGYQINQRNYKDIEIIEMQNKQNAKEIIYFAQIDNLILISFSGVLTERAITQRYDNFWSTDPKFLEATTDLSERKLFKFYFNYNQLNNFSKTFFEEEDEIMLMLDNALAYTALNINLEDEQLSFDGYTSVDSMGSYIKALAAVEPGKRRAHEIISNQAALYFSMGFQDYNTFYQNLIAEFEKGNAKDMEDIEKGIGLVEKLLKINLQEDFFNWIGNEIAFVKIRPTSQTRMEDVIVAIHANDIETAKKGLTKITEQIRKRSPLGFDIIEYKNFQINYLERQGLFKLMFGKMFEKLEKPYFTYIEDFVVFSNSKQSLTDFIDDYTMGRTLSHKKEFVNFKDNFDVKSNLAIFIQMPKMYQSMYQYSTKETQNDLKENKDLILSFARIGFLLVADNGMYTTTLIAQHDENAQNDDKLEQLEGETNDELFVRQFDSLTFKVVLPEDSLIGKERYKAFFPETQNVWYEGTIQNNLMNGTWRTYYPSGNLKFIVPYKDGKVNGTVFAHYDDAKSTKKAEAIYQDDLLQGIYLEYYDNGAQKAKLYYENAKLENDAEFYYKTGRLKIAGQYKDGLKHGKWLFYDEKGEEISKERWKKGEKK